MKKSNDINALILIMIVMFTFSFAVYSGLIWLVCWGFSIPFMWKYVFAVWAASVIITSLFKRN